MVVSISERPSRACRSVWLMSARALRSAGVVKLVANWVDTVAIGWPALTRSVPAGTRNFT